MFFFSPQYEKVFTSSMLQNYPPRTVPPPPHKTCSYVFLIHTQCRRLLDKLLCNKQRTKMTGVWPWDGPSLGRQFPWGQWRTDAVKVGRALRRSLLIIKSKNKATYEEPNWKQTSAYSVSSFVTGVRPRWTPQRTIVLIFYHSFIFLRLKHD